MPGNFSSGGRPAMLSTVSGLGILLHILVIVLALLCSHPPPSQLLTPFPSQHVIFVRMTSCMPPRLMRAGRWMILCRKTDVSYAANPQEARNFYRHHFQEAAPLALGAFSTPASHSSLSHKSSSSSPPSSTIWPRPSYSSSS